MPENRVLFIAYNFPPSGGGGVQRITKFAKYLPLFKWKPIILTATEDSYTEIDYDLYDSIIDKVKIERVKPFISQKKALHLREATEAQLFWEKDSKSKSLRSRFAKFIRDYMMIPDSQLFWVISVLFRLKTILRKYNPNIIFATSPPYSVLLLGVLVKFFSGKSLVVDFRDPWTQWFGKYRYEEKPLRKKIEKFIEKRIISHSDIVIGTTDPILSYLKTIDLSKKTSKYKLIYNGFDKDDFKGIKPQKFKKFTIVYSGKIVSNLYSAVPVIKALGELFIPNPSLKEKIEIKFIGEFYDPEAIDLINSYQLKDYVKIMGYIPHSQCISYQLGADLLLLLLNEGVTDRFTISGKIFEYLWSRKPILALIPEDSLAADILRLTNAGLIIKSDEIEKITEAIQNFYLNDKKQKIHYRSLKLFNRKNHTEKLASIFDDLRDNM